MIRKLKDEERAGVHFVNRFKVILKQAIGMNKRQWKRLLIFYGLLAIWLICMTLYTIPLLVPLIIVLLLIIPIIVIYLRWKQVQHELAQEIYRFIPLFASHYRLNNQDLIRTLYYAVESIEQVQLQQMIMKLVHLLQLNLPVQKFTQLIQEYVFSLKHAYTLRFFVLVQKAHYNQANIADALAQLAEDIQDRKKDFEAEISQTQDTRLMGLLPLVTFPLSIVFSYHLSSLIDYSYLFMQPYNLLVFCIALLFSLLSIVLSFMLKQPKTDY